MPVSFMHHRASNTSAPLTIEETFKWYASYAALHDFSFDDSLSDDSFAVNGDGGSDWLVTTVSATTMPLNYACYYHKTAARQGIAICYTPTVKYLVTTDSANVIIYKDSGSGYVAVQSTAKTTPTEADMVVTFRQIQLSDSETDLWRAIALYMNDRLIATYIEPATEFLEDAQIGFGAYHSDNVTYTDIRVPELTDFAEWATLDPGEFPMGGLQRVMDGRYLRFFIRWNGTFRAWRPKSVSNAHTFTTVQPFAGSEVTDIASIATHIRMVGAYIWAEYHDESMSEKYGHRFKEDNNPMLFTEQECYTEAVRSLKRIEEMTNTEKLSTHFVAVLEPEDRITTPNGDWLIDEIDWQLEMGNIKQSLQLKQYVWG